MTIRIILATLFMIVAGALSGCVSESVSDPKPEPTTQANEAYAEIAGSWHDESVNWTVHFSDDGTFSEDFQGNVEIRTGTFTIADGVVTLEGGDGNNNSGTIKGETIEFRLGTLARMTN